MSLGVSTLLDLPFGNLKRTTWVPYTPVSGVDPWSSRGKPTWYNCLNPTGEDPPFGVRYRPPGHSVPTPRVPS